MSIKDKSEEVRLAEGYYKQYQVHIDSGQLSPTLLNKLYAAFELSLQRFPDCCVFRCRLRIPKTFHGDTDKLFNTWFYRLAYKQKKEGINMFRIKDIAPGGMVSYHVVFIFDATPHHNKKSLEQINALYTQRVRKSWAKAVSVNREETHTICMIPPNSIMVLSADQEQYDYNVHKCFYFLSCLTKLPRIPVKHISSFFNCKYSKAHGKAKRKATEKPN